MKSLNCFMKCLKGHLDKGYNSVRQCLAENTFSKKRINNTRNILTGAEAGGECRETYAFIHTGTPY